jgi:O-methyltransferase involved in polyketide biosynthesis
MIEQTANQKSPIEETAATICDLAHFNTPNAKAILTELEKKYDKICSIAGDLAFFVAARHLTTRKLLDTLSPDTQIIEMGAGFSPHGINYSSKFAKYIEIDLPHNSAEKKEITKNLQTNPDSITYISGDLFALKTWSQVKATIDCAKPLFVFCEGVVSQYASEEQRETLARQLQSIFDHPKSKLYLDDTLKNHPELESHPIILNGRKTLANILKHTSYPEVAARSFETEIGRWKNRGFDVELVPYVNIGEQYSPITDAFKGMLCTKKVPNVDNVQIGVQAPITLFLAN